MKKERNIAVTLFRNARSLFCKLIRAIRHRNEDEILQAVVNISQEGIWLICILGAIFCFFAGFVKPHCFITAVLFVFLSAIWRSTIEEGKKIFLNEEKK